MSEQVFDSEPGSGSGSEAGASLGAALMDRVVEYDEAAAGTRLMRLGAVGELDRTRGFNYDGFTSTSAFLMARCAMSAGDANREVFLARSLPEMGYAVKSAWAGRVSVSQLEVLAHARSRHPDQFATDEVNLVEAISGLDLADTRRAIDYWVQAHDEPEVGDDDDGVEPSRVTLARTWRGRWRLDGDLDPLTGQLVDTALDQLMSQIVENSDPAALAPAPVRRGEALSELARRSLDAPDAPTDRGNRPHLAVVVDWEVLSGATRGGTAEFLDGTVISPETARLLACDANVCRLLTGPAGEILDLGRTRRTVTPAQYRAVRLRDRHCQFPGCRRPPAWCDVHHIDFWADHTGPTDLTNLVLMCRYHHTLIHRRGWALTGTPGHLQITRPDGTNLPNAPP